MVEQYDSATAFHYSSFRPPLHSLILKKVIAGEQFGTGMDIGCGTGYSTIALADYCTSVIGIDPSQDMLKNAKPHKKISYQLGSGNELHTGDHIVDIVTFAGSLYYSKSRQLVKELKRTCNRNAYIVVYDFQVIESDVLASCGIKSETVESDYDFKINFSDVPDFSERYSRIETIGLEVSATELAHILLGSSINYKAFVAKYNVKDPFDNLVDELCSKRGRQSLNVNIFYSKYLIDTN